MPRRKLPPSGYDDEPKHSLNMPASKLPCSNNVSVKNELVTMEDESIIKNVYRKDHGTIIGDKKQLSCKNEKNTTHSNSQLNCEQSDGTRNETDNNILSEEEDDIQTDFIIERDGKKFYRIKRDVNSHHARGYIEESKMTDEMFLANELLYVNSELEHGEDGFASIFIQKSTVNVVSDTLAYIWDVNTLLWERVSVKELIGYITPLLRNVLDKCVVGTKTLKDFKPYESSMKTARVLLNKLSSLKNITSFVMMRLELKARNFEANLNRIPHLFPCDDKTTVDLRTGVARPRIQEDMFSFCNPVHIVDTDLDKIHEFYASIFEDKNETIQFKQTYGGYCLTGETCDKSFLVCVGPGGNNGKSTEIAAFAAIMPNWCQAISKSVMVKDRGNDRHQAGRATTELNRLFHLRMAYYTESEDGDCFNEKTIKNISGGDDITFRLLQKEEFVGKSQAKLVLFSNFPVDWDVNGDHDKDIFSKRQRYVNYNRKFVEKNIEDCGPDEKPKDMSMESNLKGPWRNAHFSWLVKGAVEFYRHHSLNHCIPIPTDCKNDINRIMSENDRVQLFIDDMMEILPNGEVTSSDAYTLFKHWNRDSNFMNQKNFSLKLKSKGFDVKRSNGIKFVGLQFKQNAKELLKNHDFIN